MLSQFTKIAPNDPKFATLKTELSTLNDRFDYDALAREVGSSEVNGMVQFPYPEGKMSVVAKQLEKRGLQRSIDFTVQSAKDGENHLVFVTRLTDKAPQAVQLKPRKQKAKAASGQTPTGDAAASSDATASAPATGGKKK